MRLVGSHVIVLAMFDLIRADLGHGRRVNHEGASRLSAALAPFFHAGTIAILIHRFGAWCRRLVPGLRHLGWLFYYPAYGIIRVLTGIAIPTSADIGGGLVIHSWNGVFLPPCRIGRNAVFQHGVVVHPECRGIGDDVLFGPGVKVVRPVRIGSRVQIAPNTVVLHDIPDDSYVAGIPGESTRQPNSE